jgi:hypothetical protein
MNIKNGDGDPDGSKVFGELKKAFPSSECLGMSLQAAS